MESPVSFADCGETAFLNFCLTFLWGQQKINPERWLDLKTTYPNFKPFVEFFETHKTLAGIDGNRSHWATLMAFKQPLTETLLNKVVYCRRGKAELVGGNQSFLNLMSVLFAEDQTLAKSFETEKLTSHNDLELALAKWRRLIDILSCNQQYGPRLDDEKSSFKSNADLHFYLGDVGKENNFRFALQKNHFCLSPSQISAPLAISLCNRGSDPATEILLGGADMQVSKYTPFFFMDEHVVRDIPQSIEEIEKNTMIIRYLIRLSQNRTDDEYVIQEIMHKLQVWYRGQSLKDILSKLVKHPLGKVFLYKHVAPNAFLDAAHQELKDALQSILPDQYFKEMLDSPHPNRYKLVCFYGQLLGKLRTIKRYPSHQGHKTIFNGPLHEQHPLIMAAHNGRMDIVNLITDNGTANFWKVEVGSHWEDWYLLCRGFYRPEIMKFLIQHNPENFETKKEVICLKC